MKQLFFVKVTTSIWVPVCSRTKEEAGEIAQESIGDVLGITDGKLPDGALSGATGTTTTQPTDVADDATVWGEATPEEHSTVSELRAHLAEQAK
jgi:hypothetical protein